MPPQASLTFLLSPGASEIVGKRSFDFIMEYSVVFDVMNLSELQAGLTIIITAIISKSKYQGWF